VKQPILIGSALVIGAAACFGTLGYVSRSADSAGVGAFAFVFWRGAIGTLGLIALIAVVVGLRRGRLPDLRLLGRQKQLLLLVACVAGALLNISVFVAFLRTEIAVVLITFYTFPAMVTLAAVRLQDDQLDRTRVAALALSLGGLVLVLLGPLLQTGRFQLDLLGVGLAFTAAICQTIFLLINGRGFAPLSSLNVSLFVVAISGLAALPLALLGGEAAAVLRPLTDASALLWVLAGGLIGAAIPATALLTGMGIIGPSRAAILMTVEPVVGVALAGLLLGEQPVALQFAGGAAVLIAAAVLQATPHRAALAVAEADEDYQQLV
jgi:drug/metabolite transporter (DMT)-like permease